jgi:hypothetical protein
MYVLQKIEVRKKDEFMKLFGVRLILSNLFAILSCKSAVIIFFHILFTIKRKFEESSPVLVC